MDNCENHRANTKARIATPKYHSSANACERNRTKTNAATSEQSNTNVHKNKLKKKNEIGGLQKVRKISPEDNDVKLREKKYCKCGGGIYKQRSASKVHWESERPTYKLTLT